MLVTEYTPNPNLKGRARRMAASATTASSVSMKGNWRPHHDPVVLFAILEVVDLMQLSQHVGIDGTNGQQYLHHQQQQQEEQQFITKVRVRASEVQHHKSRNNNSTMNNDNNNCYYAEEDVADDDCSNDSRSFSYTVQRMRIKIHQHLAAATTTTTVGTKSTCNSSNNRTTPLTNGDCRWDPNENSTPNNIHNTLDSMCFDMEIYDAVSREYVPMSLVDHENTDLVERFGTRLRIRVMETNPSNPCDGCTRREQAPMLALQGRYFPFDGSLMVQRNPIPAPWQGTYSNSSSEALDDAADVTVQPEETVVLSFTETPNEPSAGTGWNVWDGALLMAHYLQHGSIHLHNQRVLELGAGCGVAGITAAALGRHSDVILTDLPHVVPLLEQNVKRNRHAFVSSNVTVQTCNWFQPSPDLLKPRGSELTQWTTPFDIILVADCVWMEELVAPLLSVLKKLTDEPHQESNKYNKNDEIEIEVEEKHKEEKDMLEGMDVNGSINFESMAQSSLRSLNHMDLIRLPKGNKASPVCSWVDIYRRPSLTRPDHEASYECLLDHEFEDHPGSSIRKQQERSISEFADTMCQAMIQEQENNATTINNNTNNYGPLVLISYQQRGKATHDAFRRGLHELFSQVEVLDPPNMDKPDVFYLLACRR